MLFRVKLDVERAKQSFGTMVPDTTGLVLFQQALARKAGSEPVDRAALCDGPCGAQSVQSLMRGLSMWGGSSFGRAF